MYHGTTYSRAKSIVAEGWIYRTNGNRAVYRNRSRALCRWCTSHRGGGICRPGLSERTPAQRHAEAGGVRGGCQCQYVALDKKETDNPSTEWAVRHPEQTGPYYRCDTDLPRWCVTRWLLLQFVSPQDRWDFIDERIELKDAGLADQQWRRSLSALQ